MEYNSSEADDIWSEAYSEKVDLCIINEEEYYAVDYQLDNIEQLINTIINTNKDSSRDYYSSNLQANEQTDIEIANLNHYKILKYEDYPKQLMMFYFKMDINCSSPCVISIKDYIECIENYQNELPEYLIFAFLSKSSLSSPNPQLFMKNLEFSNYYYELSLAHLNRNIDKNRIEIYMIHTLVILITIDDAINRHFYKYSRLVTCIKLTQILGLDSLDLNSISNRFNISKSNLKKVFLYIKFYNNEAEKVFNKPKLLKCKELTYEDYSIRIEDNDGDFNEKHLCILPKDYHLTFKAFNYLGKFLFNRFDLLERDLESKSPTSNFNDCLYLIQSIKSNYYSKPSNIKYSISCLNSALIVKDPLLWRRIYLYQTVLKLVSLVYGLLVRVIHKLKIDQIIILTQHVIKFNEKILSLLKDQQSLLLKSANNCVHLNSATFFYFGRLLLDMIEKLKQRNIFINSNKLKILETMVRAEFDCFRSLINNLKSDWEGSNEVLKIISKRYESI